MFLLQEASQYEIDANKFVSSIFLNMTYLTGAFTPEFESVFFGNAPSLGPDPALISDLTMAGTLVNVIAWSGAFVLGIDRF